MTKEIIVGDPSPNVEFIIKEKDEKPVSVKYYDDCDDVFKYVDGVSRALEGITFSKYTIAQGYFDWLIENGYIKPKTKLLKKIDAEDT